ncbi:MAG: hypothetical protein J0I29_12455 [Rhizobiales bacterium]|nr:hypothetical protein [Hyphomicrobiales bacterium]
MKFACLPIVVSLLYSTMASAETCRFIDKRHEREACYAQQDEERAAKAKTAEAAKKAAIASPPMTEDDRAMFRTLHSICRGC